MPKSKKAKIVKNTSGLNPSQRRAVEFESGPLLVVAGAGTGKTSVITNRIKRLLDKKKVGPQNILALTFTEKAAAEMVNRVGDAMPLGYEEPWIYTFHAFADRVLREEGLEIGLDPSYKIISGPNQWLLFRKNLFAFDLKYFRPLGNPTKFVSAILKFISRCQDENISPNDLANFAAVFDGDKDEKGRWLELAAAYKKYEELKLAQPKMDFGDLIVWTVKLFRERPNILKKYQSQFTHILVDEFQDTNYAQYELVKLLFPSTQAAGDRSLLTVGDDSQSIYKFRGAAVSNILEFQKDYPGAKMISLLQNYRSGQTILDAAYKLIRNNNPDTLESKLGISKELVSKVAGKGSAQAWQAEIMEEEADFVVSKMLELLAAEPDLTYKDFAILARANSHLDPFVLALRKYGIPYQLVGNRGLYDRDEILDILALLRVVINPNDSVSLYRVLNIQSLGVSPEVISSVLAQSRTQRVSLWAVVGQLQGAALKLPPIITEFSQEITKNLPSDFIHKLVTKINYVSQFLTEESVENQLRIKNLNLLLSKAKEFELSYRQEYKRNPSIIDFVDYLDLVIDAGENPAQAQIEDIDTVNLLTVHASKGLEFSVVFMVNLVSDRFPTRSRKDSIEIPDPLIKETLPVGDAHVQEERRLFYVGMTRAKKYLFFTLAKSYGGGREKVPSGFIEETGVVTRPVVFLKQNQVGLFGLESAFRNLAVTKIKGSAPEYLSYSQIDTYKTCPLQYKYRYVLGIPSLPNHALSFGNTIHSTLKDFHTALMFEPVSLDKFYSFYEKNWQPAGYLDDAHRSLRFESGKKLLEHYWHKNKDLRQNPLALEKSFNVKIGGIKFYGKIDRIDPVSNGGVEIIDYKTGTPKDQKEVDKDDQVAYYAIAAREALGLVPKKLTYYFVENGTQVSTTRSQKQLDEKKAEVKEAVEKIANSEFNATPGMHCNWCDYKTVCPYAWKG